MNWKQYYDTRYQEKISGSLNRIQLFHNADNRSLITDLNRWGVLSEGMIVLDIGSGWAIHSELIGKTTDSRFLKMDISEVAMHRILSQQSSEHLVGVLAGNAMNLPVASQSIDMIICSQVLEHIPDDMLALLEMKRVLKTDGVLVITVPNCLKDMFSIFRPLERHFDQAGHIHEYCMESLAEKIREIKFTVELTRIHCFFTFWFWAWVERTRWSRRVEFLLTRGALAQYLIERILTYIMVIENMMLGKLNYGGMSIQIIARKQASPTFSEKT